MKKILNNNTNIFDKLRRKAIPFVVAGSLVTSIPVSVNAAEDTKKIVSNVDVEEGNYIKQEQGSFAIKTNGKTSEELFEAKAKFLLGDSYDQYVNGQNISELSSRFNDIYGEGAFEQLKEYEIASKGLSNSKLNMEYANAGLALGHEQKEMSIFPNNKKDKQNRIDALNLKMSAIKNIMSKNQDMYTTVYNMNEFVSACLANASLNGKIDSFDKVWDTYKKEVLDPVVAIVDIDGKLVSIDMTYSSGKYTVFNTIVHNPATYGLIPQIKSQGLSK